MVNAITYENQIKTKVFQMESIILTSRLTFYRNLLYIVTKTFQMFFFNHLSM